MKIDKSYVLTSIFLLFITFQTFAQSDNNSNFGEVTGKVIDASNSAVVYASISLLKDDSTYINSAISSATGDFKIVDIEPGTYKLQIDHIEFESYSTEVFTLSANQTKVFEAVTLSSSVNSLDQVVITKKKRLIEVKADKLIFNVASSPSASGTNGLDLLKKSPGVRVDIDNEISLLGKKNVQVYLNGVESRLSGDDLTTFLQSLSSDTVDSIEIITNPSSKYEAEGTGGIINIRMKKNVATGFNGSAGSSFTQGIKHKYRNNLSLNLGTERLNSSVTVTQSEDQDVEFFNDSKQQNNSSLYLNSEEIKVRKGYNVGLSLDAQLNQQHYLSLSGRGIFNKNDDALNSRTDIYQTEPFEFTEILNSESYLDGQSNNLIANLNHYWNTGSSSSLSTNFSIGDYDTKKNTLQPNTRYEMDGSTIISEDNSTFDAETKIDLWSVKTDFEKEWPRVTLSAGAKYAQIVTENGFDFYNFENEAPVLDETKSNDFSYTENVAAVYASASVKIGSALTVNGGLRVENTDSRGKLTSVVPNDNKDVPRNYTDYFPNFGILLDSDNNHAWSFSLGRRITRPNYQDLNPFESPTSQLVVWKGNPFLKPNYIMNYQLSYTFQQSLVVVASYSRTKDFFAKIVEITDENMTQIIPRNMDKSINYGLSLSYPLTITKFWEVIAFGNISRQSYEGDLGNTIIDLQATLWNYQIQSIFNIPEGFLLDLTYNHQGDWIWRGSVFIKGSKGLSFGIRKEFLDKKIQLRVTGSDIFKSQSDYPYYSDYGGIDLDGVYTDDGRRFGLGVTFKFGDQKARTKKKTNNALDDELNRIGN